MLFCLPAHTSPHSDAIFEPDESDSPSTQACFSDHPLDKMQCDSTYIFKLGESRNFGTGFISTPIQAGTDTARGIVRIGALSNASYEFNSMLFGHSDNAASLEGAFVKYNMEGTLDTSFHTDGKMTFDPTASDDLIHSAQQIENSSVVFAGRGGANNVNWLVGRIKSDGILDTSFFTSGVRIDAFYTEDEILRGLTINTVGSRHLVAGGYAWKNGHYNFVVAAYNSAGNLDTGFNTTGVRLTEMSGNDNGALAVGTLTTGSNFVNFPMLVGPVHNGSNWDFGIARYTSTGELDTAFNTAGTNTVPVLSSNDKPYSIAVTSTSTYVGGYTYNGSNNDFAVVKFKTNGVLDTAFNTNGSVTTSFFAGDDVIFAMQIQTGGILAVGSADNGGNVEVAVARYFFNGTLDTSFHTDGKNTFDGYGQKDVGVGIRLHAFAPWYTIAAKVTNGGNEDFATLRLETDGTFAAASAPSKSIASTGDGIIIRDLSGGTDTLVASGSSSNAGASFGVTVGNRGGDIFVTGYSFGGKSPFLDTSFNTVGGTTFDLGATETVGGFNYQTGTNLLRIAGDNGADFFIAVVKYPSYTLDTSFNTIGSMTVGFSGTDIPYAINSDNLVAGKDGAGTSNFAVAKFLGTGGLDTSFSTDGKAAYAPTGNAALIKFVGPGPRAMLIGQDTLDIVVQRITSDGQVDTTFYTTGVRAFDLGGTETIGAGMNAATGHFYFVGGNGSDFVLGKFHSNGLLDTTFNSGGTNTIDFGGAGEKAKAIKEAWRSKIIYVAGDDGTNFLLARISSDGQLDTSFNTNGKRSYSLIGSSTLNELEMQREGLICMYGSSNTNADAAALCVNP